LRVRWLLNDRRCSSHCLDTSARWTPTRQINGQLLLDSRQCVVPRCERASRSRGEDARREMLTRGTSRRARVSRVRPPSQCALSLARSPSAKGQEGQAGEDGPAGDGPRSIAKPKVDTGEVKGDTRSLYASLLFKKTRARCHPERARTRERGTCFWGEAARSEGSAFGEKPRAARDLLLGRSRAQRGICFLGRIARARTCFGEKCAKRGICFWGARERGTS